LENQLASAAFYLMNMGYSRDDIQERFNEVRQDPTRLEALFNLQQREIYSTPSEIQQGSSASPPSHQEPSLDQSQDLNETIARHIRSIHQDITEERAQKVELIVEQIKAHVRDGMSELQEKVFRQMHPDRLTRALKTLKTTKRKSKRMNLYLEWYTASLLLSKIELKVEHWQVSSAAGHGSAGVYTAGIDFSRYDNIVREFSDGKLTKVVNISKRILQNPTKKAIQKLGQDLIAETGFDEHLYFTD
jgi:gas vesicle protein